MISAVVEGWTRQYGDDPGSNLGSVIVRDDEQDMPDGTKANVMVSAWTPTPTELWALANGANVHVAIMGDRPPPMAVEVGEIPEGAKAAITVNITAGWQIPPATGAENA